MWTQKRSQNRSRLIHDPAVTLLDSSLNDESRGWCARGFLYLDCCGTSW